MPSGRALTLVGVAVALLPVATAAQVPAAAVEQATTATLDCWAAVGPAGVDKKLLRDRGWQAATISGVKTPPGVQVLGRRGFATLILLNDAPAFRQRCGVGSPLAKAADIGGVADRLAVRLSKMTPPPRAGVRDGRRLIAAGPRVLAIADTSRGTQPAVEVTVVYMPQGTK